MRSPRVCCDITYGTTTIGFDYLRDNLAFRLRSEAKLSYPSSMKSDSI